MATNESTPEVLDIRDVLTATHADAPDADSLGALLTFTTVGDHTIVSVDADAAGSATPLQIATLGISGITLQQLLGDNLDIAC